MSDATPKQGAIAIDGTARPSSPPHPAVLAVAGLLSLAVGIGIGRFAYTPILPYMIAGLELDRSEAGLIASANYLGYFVGALAAAWRAVPGEPRLWLLGALALCGLSTGAMALTTSLAPFLILRFAGGAAGALVMVLASSLVMDRLAAAGRDGWAAVMYAGVGTGIAISSLAVPAAASGESDWQGPWLLCGGLAIVLSILAALLLRAPRASAAGRTRSGAGGARTGLARLIVAYGLVGFGYVITATFVADMVRADPVLQPAEHLVWLCVGLTAAPSVALWGWAGRRWGNERAFAVGCLVEGAGVALSVLGGGIWSILLAAGLLGGTFVGLTAIGLIEARHLSAGDPRRNIALMTAAWGLGQMVGPTFAGVLYDSLGSYLVPSLLAAVALVAAALLTASIAWSRRAA
ncbi:MAG: YbfB/YjiJ family MFS transporter [Rhodospirillales bacterium]|nr:YbfB/YjiJ family MFS transporter [Rhodospirillales bacterium]MDE0377775.1 YbfB/YjiJ family MFS transporter [Rhodospirillales bacterium]